MLRLPRLLSILVTQLFRSRRDLLLENLALRQQIEVLRRRRPQPRFAASDRLFWLTLRRLWSGWKQALILVQPETVVRWHRAGFKLYWTWLSRHRAPVGRKCINRDLRQLIFRMVAENPTWGAPRIHGELKMLGFDVSERTVLRWMRKAPRSPEPAKRRAAFLSNHLEVIAAMDFFTVPTLTFGVLHCFFVIAHDRRHILHWNVTRHPSSSWVTQQLREAFPYDSAPKYLIFDSRRDLLDDVIVLNERHMKRLMKEYARYYHDDRTHLALAKGTPAGREARKNPGIDRRIISMPRLGGLHHRYDQAA